METVNKPSATGSMDPRRRKMIIWGAVGAVILIVIIWIATSYNSLVNKQEKVEQQWSQVQNMYQRRLDLVPQLVNVVKGVSGFEKNTLVDVVNARVSAAKVNVQMTGEGAQQQQALQDSVAVATNRFIAVIESYPNIKSTDAYRGFQAQLKGTEQRIKVARNDFNEAINVYNRKVRSFPSNIIANMFGFKRRDGFKADVGAENAIEIKF
ncbi:MAG TPA: LemA family protein [Chitinophagaceae bacterium]|jgi:LemA protein|nr:LemA family protein [Chitinophagaceae bacterium]